MPDYRGNTTQIYKALQGSGFSGLGSNADEFYERMQDSSNRRKVYDYLSKKGATGLGKDFDEFSSYVYDPSTNRAKPVTKTKSAWEQVVDKYSPAVKGAPQMLTPSAQQEWKRNELSRELDHNKVDKAIDRRNAQNVKQASPYKPIPTEQELIDQSMPDWGEEQKQIDSAFDKTVKKAEARGHKAYEETMKNMPSTMTEEGQWGYGMLAQRRANEEVTPSKIIGAIQEQILGKPIDGGNSEGTGETAPVAKSVNEKASALHAQRIYNYVRDKLIEKRVPQSKWATFFRTMMSNNLLSNLIKATIMTPEQLQYESMSMSDNYNKHQLGSVAKVSANVAGVATDPTTWVSGGVGNAAAQGAGRLFLNSSAKFGVNQAGRMLAGKGANWLMPKIVGGAANFATFEGLGTLSGQIGSGQNIDLGEIGKSTIKGAAMGTLIPVFSNYLGKGADWTMKKVHMNPATVTGKAVRYGADFGTRTAVFAGGNIVQQWASDPHFNWETADYGEALLDAATTNLGFDLYHVVKAGIKTKGANFTQMLSKPHEDKVFKLTQDDVRTAQKCGLKVENVNDLINAIGNMAERDAQNGKKYNTDDTAKQFGEMMNETELGQFLQNENMTQSLLCKIKNAVTGDLRLPQANNVEMREDNGKFIVTTSNNMGVVEERTFNQESDARRWMDAEKDDCRVGRVRAQEQFVNSRELGRVMQEAGEEVMGKYNLTHEEFIDILTKNGELTPDEKAVRDDYDNYFKTRTAQKIYAGANEKEKGDLQKIRESVAKEYGISDKDMKRIAESEYKRLNSKEQNIFRAYEQALEKETKPVDEQAKAVEEADKAIDATIDAVAKNIQVHDVVMPDTGERETLLVRSDGSGVSLSQAYEDGKSASSETIKPSLQILGEQVQPAVKEAIDKAFEEHTVLEMLERLDGNMDDATIQYVEAKMQQQGYADNVKNQTVAKAVETVRNSYGTTEGVVRKAVIGGKEVILTGKEGDEFCYYKESGSDMVQYIEWDKVSNIQDVDVSAETATAIEQAKSAAMAEVAHKFAHEPETHTDYKADDSFYALDDKGNVKPHKVVGVDANGNVTYGVVGDNGEPKDMKTATKAQLQQMEDDAYRVRNGIVPTEESAKVEAPVAENAPVEEATANEQPTEEVKPQSYLEQIPKDKKGRPEWNKAESPEVASKALLEIYNGNEDDAISTVDAIIEGAKADVDKAGKAEVKPSSDPNDVIEQRAKIKKAKDEAAKNLKFWRDVKSKLQTAFLDGEEVAEEETANDAVNNIIEQKKNLSNKAKVDSVGLDESATPYDYVLGWIASGAKFKWGNGEHSQGLKNETGYSNKDVAPFLLDNKNGQTPDQMAHAIYEAMPERLREQTDDMEIKDHILDIIQSFKNYKDMADEFVKRNTYDESQIEEQRPTAEQTKVEESATNNAEEIPINTEDMPFSRTEKPASSYDKKMAEMKADIEKNKAELAEKQQRQIEKSVKAAVDEGKRLGTEIHVLNTIDDLREVLGKGYSDEDLEGVNAFKKGDEVYIYAPNMTDERFAVQQVWHEVVAHKGIKALFSEKDLNKFFADVFKYMSKGAKERFAMYVFNSLDSKERKATGFDSYKELAKDESAKKKFFEDHYEHIADEYVAREHAERGEFNRGVWQTFKDWLNHYAHKFGFADFSDSEIRYILGKSKENLAKGINNESTSKNRDASELAAKSEDSAIANSGAKIGNNPDVNKRFTEIIEDLHKGNTKDPQELLHELAWAFDKSSYATKDSYYFDVSDEAGIRISNHRANPSSFKMKNNADKDQYGFVVKIHNNKSVKGKGVDYLEYIYYPDKIQSAESQKALVEGVMSFAKTADFHSLPKPNRMRGFGKFAEAAKKFQMNDDVIVANKPNDAPLFSKREEKDEKKSLMGVHNLTEDKLRKVLKQGGLANPSLAVIDTDNHIHTNYGEISLIPKSSLIDSKTGKNAGTFTADAWTPTYPQVTRRMNNKGRTQYYKDMRVLDDEPQSIRSKMNTRFDSWMEQGNHPEDLSFWYLKEKGIEPEKVYYESDVPAEDKEAFKRIMDGKDRFGQLSLEEKKQMYDLIAKDRETTAEELLDKYEAIKEDRKKDLENEERPYFKKLTEDFIAEVETYGLPYRMISDYIYKMEQAVKRDGTVNPDATILTAAKQVKEQGLESDFKRWLDDKAESYGIEEWLFDGFDNNGIKKWKRNTLQNASRMMKKQGLNGATGLTSTGTMIAAVANRLKSTKDIRKYKKNLNTTLEEHEEFKKKWGDILIDLSEKCGTGFNDWAGEERLREALGEKNPAEHLKKEYGVDLSSEDRQLLDTFIHEVRENFPTGYFETKFERPVTLDEFAVAVIPEGTSDDVIAGLKSAGLDVRTYSKESEESRKKAVMDAVNSRNDILFSRKDEDNEFVKDRKAKELANMFRANALDEFSETVQDYIFNNPAVKEKLGDGSASDIYDYLMSLNENEYKRATRGESYYPVTPYDRLHSMSKDEAMEDVEEFAFLVKNNFIEDKVSNKEWLKKNMPELVNSVTFNENARPTEEARKTLGFDENAGIDSGYSNIDDDALEVAVRNRELDRKGEESVRFAIDEYKKRMKAFHGSGADFDHFDIKFLGTGEGAQAYGVGHYVTEVEGIGRKYAMENAHGYDDYIEAKDRWQDSRRKVQNVLYRIKDEENNIESLRLTIDNEKQELKEQQEERSKLVKKYGEEHYKVKNFDFYEPIESLERDIRNHENMIKGHEDTIIECRKNLPRFQEEEQQAKEIMDGIEKEITRVLYTVEIPEDNGSNYLDWNKTSVRAVNKMLKAMTDDQKERISEIPVSKYNNGSEILGKEDLKNRILWHIHNSGWKNLYEIATIATGDKQAASELLSRAGFVGIKYPAEYRSGGRKDGASNYVIFDDANLAITDKVRFSKREEQSYQSAFKDKDEKKASEIVRDAFAKAFPDTKVEDEDGKPLAVYHGTKGDFNIFDISHTGDNLDYGTMGMGFYFTSKEDNANNIAKNAQGEGEPNAMKVYLDIRNPKEIKWNELDGENRTKSERLTAKARAKGYDGFVATTPWGAKWYVAFEPNQIKSAEPFTYDDAGNLISLNERFNEKSNDIRFSFTGTKGAITADELEGTKLRQDNLKKADEMEKDGKTARQVKLATGWERGADGKWRYEIDDDVKTIEDNLTSFRRNVEKRLWALEKEENEAYKKFDSLDRRIPARLTSEYTDEQKAKFREMRKERDRLWKEYIAVGNQIRDFKSAREDGKYLLSDIYGEGHKLFKYYPQLAKLKVRFEDERKMDGYLGWYSGKEIVVADRSFESTARTLLHEVQHAIQSEEGFAKGGMPETAKLYVDELSKKSNVWEYSLECDRIAKEINSSSPYDIERKMFEDLGIKTAEDEKKAIEEGWIPNKEGRAKGYNLWARGYDGEGYEDAYNEYVGKLRKSGSATYWDDTPNNLYNRLAGEVEARNTANFLRSKMNESQRRKLLSTKTEDIPREMQIVTFSKREEPSYESNGIERDELGRPIMPQFKDRAEILSPEGMAKLKEWSKEARRWDMEHPLDVKNRKAAASKVERLIKTALDDADVDEVTKAKLNSAMKAIKNTNTFNLSQMTSKGFKIAAGAINKAYEKQIHDLMMLKVRDKNGRGNAVGKKIDAITAQAMETLRGYYDKEKKRFTVDSSVIDAKIAELQDKIANSIDEGAMTDDETMKNRAQMETLNILKRVSESNVTGAKLQELIDGGKQNEERLKELYKMKREGHMNYKDADGNTVVVDDEIASIKKMQEANDLDINAQLQAKMDALDVIKTKLADLVDDGRDYRKSKFEKEQQRRSSIVGSVMESIASDKKISQRDIDTRKYESTRNPFKMLWNASMDSFEYMCKTYATNGLTGDNFLYDYFIKGKEGVIEASNNYENAMRRHAETIEAKCQEIYGKKFLDVVEDNSKLVEHPDVYVDVDKNKRGDNTLGEQGGKREISLTKGEGTYIYMLWRMADGQAQLLRQGFTEATIEEIGEFIGKENQQFADWMQLEYLPQMREKYNDRYIEVFDTSMAHIDNYVPLRRSKMKIADKEDMTATGNGNPQVVTKGANALIERTHNTNNIDCTADAFKVLYDHLNEMEEWYNFARVRQDLQYVVGSPAVRNRMNRNNTGSYQRFVEAAKAAAHVRGGGDMAFADKAWSELAKAFTTGAIAYRYGTALKQTLSLPAFLDYSGDPKFLAKFIMNTGVEYITDAIGSLPKTVANLGVGMDERFKNRANSEALFTEGMTRNMAWCLNNIPNFYERVINQATAIDPIMNEKTDWRKTGKFGEDFFYYLSKYRDKYAKAGFAANKLVDAATCAIGAKTIYDYKYGQLMEGVKGRYEEGTDEYERARQEAHRLAVIDATLAYNSSQQSSHPAFLAPLQREKTFASKMLTLFKNSPISYSRKLSASLQDLYRIAGNTKDGNLTRYYTQRIMLDNENMSVDDARKEARKVIRNRGMKAMWGAALYGYILPWLWAQGGKGLLGLITPDEDEDKMTDKEKEQKKWEGYAETSSFFFDGVPTVMIATDIPKIWMNVSNDWSINTSNAGMQMLNDALTQGKRIYDEQGIASPQFASFVANRALKNGLGADIETWSNIALGLCNLAKDGYISAKDLVAGDDTPKTKEQAIIDLMFLLNSPRSQRIALAKDFYKDMPYEDYEYAVRVASNNFAETMPYLGWLPQSKTITEKKAKQMYDEFLRYHSKDGSAQKRAENKESVKSVNEERITNISHEKMDDYVKRSGRYEEMNELDDWLSDFSVLNAAHNTWVSLKKNDPDEADKYEEAHAKELDDYKANIGKFRRVNSVIRRFDRGGENEDVLFDEVMELLKE